MANKNRDNFTEKTKRLIGGGAGWLCSYRQCRASTIGATSDGNGLLILGEACHIRAAAPGGPRYDENMSPEERASAKNGIWMCRNHAKAIDSSDPEYTAEKLHEWKKQVEHESWQRVLAGGDSLAPSVVTDADLNARFKAAAEADIAVFRRTSRWPPTSVQLLLKVPGFDEPVRASVLAEAAVMFGDLVLVAAPGMGKTTTLFQIAEGLLARDAGGPLFVRLGDWATGNATILASILQRPAFHRMTEDDLRVVASKPGVVLLLDGWNELDSAARTRARVQIETLQAELPELGLVVATRRQVMDLPLTGTAIDLLPLNETQQEQIAVAMRGETGRQIVDQAWRTHGLRELVTIPLYLRTLVSLPQGTPFPATKEEILRRFVAMHESEPRCAEDLYKETLGFHQNYLTELAVIGTAMVTTTIGDTAARRSISRAAAPLAEVGDIASAPPPNAVLDALVSSHLLMRVGDPPGYSFQHQQFQEWYASHAVERRILAEIDDPSDRQKLKAEIFNYHTWEEPILFAVERLARGNAEQRAECGKAILAAFEVDPILAAEMIFRATDDVWSLIGDKIQDLVTRWHQAGTVDRAQRFMMTSGRPEFLNMVWPLISHENEQISLSALRNCSRFRPSILGPDAIQKITSLPARPRMVMLHEIASRSGMDGLDLASAITKDDHDPELQVMIIGALAFRRADRHVEVVLSEAPDATFDRIVGKNIINEPVSEPIREKLAAAKQRQAGQITAYDRLHSIVYAQDNDDRSVDVVAIIAEASIEAGQMQIVTAARQRYPAAVAEGLLTRVRAGRPLFHSADDILASAGFRLEDDQIYEIAISELSRQDVRMDAAASVLGPISAGRVVDALFDLNTRIRQGGHIDRAANAEHSTLLQRVAHIPGDSLVAAVIARSHGANTRRLAQLAHLLHRHPSAGDSERDRLFDEASLAAIQGMIQTWGEQMLASDDATRAEKAEIASIASYAPSADLLPILKRLLDDNLERFQAFHEQAIAEGWHQSAAKNEATQPHTWEYKRAFLAIKSPETTAMMYGYLTHPHFGQLAAEVIVQQWADANDPQKIRRFMGGIDFSGVFDKRAARIAAPDTSTQEADAIFAAVDGLLAQDPLTDQQRNLAIGLGIAAARLPHGRHNATIQRLIALAPRTARPGLLLSLVLSGEEIDIQLISDGLAETLELAQTQTWILTDNGRFQITDWLQLLPFVNRPLDAIPILRTLPPALRDPRFLELLPRCVSDLPSEQFENFLFALAEEDPRFYRNHQWVNSTLRQQTLSSAIRLVNAAASGAFDDQQPSQWHMAREIAGLIAADHDVRAHVYALLKDGVTSRGFALLARAVTESPDAEGILLLIKIERSGQGSYINFRTIEQTVTNHVPLGDWQGAHEIIPIPATELRQQLLAQTTDGGPADIAAKYLAQMDMVRDSFGMPAKEPRHPDLASGRSWPIIPAAISRG